MTAATVAVIGAGLIGLKHIDILLTMPDVSLIGVVDPAPAARDACAERQLQWFNDVTDLLDNARPDGAIIATPNVLHASIGMRCAENGVHILVEKPITDTVESANALTEACERAGVRLLVGHFRRYNPVLKEARKIVRDGMLGRLLTVRAACLLRKPDEYFKTHWRVNDGGGPILINLVHDIDALRFVCGEIVRVQAVSTHGARGLPVEDTAAALIVFQNGALGTLILSDAATAPWSWELTSGENPFYPRQFANCYDFSGTAASLTAPILELWRYPGERGWGAHLARELVHVVPADPYVEQMKHFLRVVRGEEDPLVTGWEGMKTLEVTLAVARSAATDQSIALPM